MSVFICLYCVVIVVVAYCSNNSFVNAVSNERTGGGMRVYVGVVYLGGDDGRWPCGCLCVCF